MKFNEFKYARPDFEEMKAKLTALVSDFKNAASAKEQLEIFDEINMLRRHADTMANLASTRHSIDTRDEFYDAENTYWDEAGPLYEELNAAIYEAILNSAFRDELEAKLGTQFFKLAEYSLKSFSPEIISDLQEENRLASDYDKLIASAKIMFDGEERTLAGMGKYMQDKDQNVREAAWTARIAFFEEHEEKLDDIYDQLVSVRTKIAKKLGFNNFVELGYVRMNRTDYTPEMVANFRSQVKEFIVPVASEIYELQRKRLGYDKLRYFDLNFKFQSGNATPKGDPDFILEQGIKMYDELSPETKEFFNLMMDKDLLDVLNKPGKQGGGYCTEFTEFAVPFIFANFNGTSGDIDVLTHEVGHAFQSYESRHLSIPELTFPTYDSCEIHSMSMEFFCWPWMENFFKEDTEKYKYTHLAGAITFIPYGVAVDEFQHFIYANPTATKTQRKSEWRRLEKQYLPFRNFDGADYLERGGWWHQQGHIFSTPFYYIDYTLAQICALQFWKNMHEDQEAAWHDYVKLCKVGGTKSFTELVAYGNLKSPFADGCVESVISEIAAWLKEAAKQLPS